MGRFSDLCGSSICCFECSYFGGLSLIAFSAGGISLGAGIIDQIDTPQEAILDWLNKYHKGWRSIKKTEKPNVWLVEVESYKWLKITVEKDLFCDYVVKNVQCINNSKNVDYINHFLKNRFSNIETTNHRSSQGTEENIPEEWQEFWEDIKEKG